MTPDPRIPALLTEGQRRHLTATLALVERAVGQVAALARRDGSPESALLSQGQDDIPASVREPLVAAAADVAVIIEQLVSRFQLPASSASHRRTAEALLVSSLVEIEDTGSTSLRGYGHVHPDVALHLDPLLERLHHSIAQMRYVLGAT